MSHAVFYLKAGLRSQLLPYGYIQTGCYDRSLVMTHFSLEAHGTTRSYA